MTWASTTVPNWEKNSLRLAPITPTFAIYQIDPKRAIPKAEHAKSAKIFVGGLAPSVNNASLREFFSQFGTVVDAHVSALGIARLGSIW
jgi:hypothetical protein